MKSESRGRCVQGHMQTHPWGSSKASPRAQFRFVVFSRPSWNGESSLSRSITQAPSNDTHPPCLSEVLWFLVHTGTCPHCATSPLVLGLCKGAKLRPEKGVSLARGSLTLEQEGRGSRFPKALNDNFSFNQGMGAQHGWRVHSVTPGSNTPDLSALLLTQL